MAQPKTSGAGLIRFQLPFRSGQYADNTKYFLLHRGGAGLERGQLFDVWLGQTPGENWWLACAGKESTSAFIVRRLARGNPGPKLLSP